MYTTIYVIENKMLSLLLKRFNYKKYKNSFFLLQKKKYNLLKYVNLNNIFLRGDFETILNYRTNYRSNLKIPMFNNVYHCLHINT